MNVSFSMGFFSKFEEAAINQSIDTIKKFRKGRANITQAQNAFKILASGKSLYKLQNFNEDDTRAELYFWIMGNHLENIYGNYEKILHLDNYNCQGVSHDFIRVHSNECSDIDFSGWY